MGFRGVRADFVAMHAVLGLAGCSSSSSPGVQADAGGTDSATADSASAGPGDGGTASFEGTWTCAGTQTLTFTTPTGTPPMMETVGPGYMLVISTTEAGLSETSNGCTFTLSESGDMATAAPTGQMCVSGSILQSNPKGSSDATYSMGTMTLTSATTMTSSGSFTFTDSAIRSDGGRDLYAGTGTYMLTCTKQ